jgi:hypothetical protein
MSVFFTTGFIVILDITCIPYNTLRFFVVVFICSGAVQVHNTR